MTADEAPDLFGYDPPPPPPQIPAPKPAPAPPVDADDDVVPVLPGQIGLDL